MIDKITYLSLQEDLEKAIFFKTNKEENKSRVIARQVAGKAIKILFSELKNKHGSSATPYECLLIAKNYPEIFLPILTEIDTLTRKVNPDYTFPENLDLIHSSKKIIEFVQEYK